MPYVNEINFEYSTVKLVPDGHVDSGDNVYTVIVGKNGVGKSKMLSSIANDYIRQYLEDDDFLDYEPKVIAASTSPFDKFPTLPRRVSYSETNYRYIGMRNEGIYNTSSSIALISSAAKGLLSSSVHGQKNPRLVEVFDALGFYPALEMVFKPTYLKVHSRVNYEFEYNRVVQTRREEVDSIERDYGIAVEDKFLDILDAMSEKNFHKTIHAIRHLHYFVDRKRAIRLHLDVSSNLAYVMEPSGAAGGDIVESILVLLKSGFIRLMDLLVHKKDYGEMSLKRASSGEQCLTVLMLGIAGHITDGSVILIDEPEVSLHPKWQETFMPLLMNAFSAFVGCHFIIATHSPQVISRLSDKNCYILSLSKRTINHSRDFYQRSADYQLAELFDAPGLMNEYISRLAFNLLARVKSEQRLKADHIADLDRLVEFSYNLDANDPLVELINSVKEVCKFYGSH